MRYLVLFALFLLMDHYSEGQQTERPGIESFYRHIITSLAADSMKGRLAGTQDEVLACALLEKEFRSIKHFKPAVQVFTYRTGDTGKQQKGRNIYCYVDNHADSTILIGAHYDHIGMGGPMTRSYGQNKVHPGADDNASGVALMLGLAHRYHEWAHNTYNYLFVGYSAHEEGLYGSAAFCRYCTGHFKPVRCVLNFDMVGRLDNSEKAISIYSSQTLRRVELPPPPGNINLRALTDEPEKIFQTDCKAFAENRIECLSFTTGTHQDYHKITDVPSKINYAGIWMIQQYAETILAGMN